MPLSILEALFGAAQAVDAVGAVTGVEKRRHTPLALFIFWVLLASTGFPFWDWYAPAMKNEVSVWWDIFAVTWIVAAIYVPVATVIAIGRARGWGRAVSPRDTGDAAARVREER